MDEGAARTPSGAQGFPHLPEFGEQVPDQGSDPQSVLEEFAGGGQVVGTAADPAGDRVSWEFDPAVESALDSMDVAGWSWGDVAGVGSDLLGFPVGVAGFVAGGMGSTAEGGAELSVGPGGVAVGSVPEAVDAAEGLESAELLREAARVEARRARDAGEDYSGAALGKRFGKGKGWGQQRLAEIKDEGGATRSDLQEREQERLREAGRLEARRARDAGELYTGAVLGAKFGKSRSWGKARLAEIRDEVGGVGRAMRATEREWAWEREREAARVEARRARDAGEPYTGASLGKKFGKSMEWGSKRLTEIRNEGGAGYSILRGQGEQQL
ncbi:hypothetical protein [Saccharopolyspora phatthalungensis]|uniref:Uncharacterized protein n=1 Tax=Saccharopolyspora phatthalungensis TaxID=664693 RepID=A0A840QDH6_9PSEU|nr:hypothetical protein [Saccharopolyspora phatthalungensis]MBB5156505.1 hypothetical protein [Saccharopolyspora phatthalungensis]